MALHGTRGGSNSTPLNGYCRFGRSPNGDWNTQIPLGYSTFCDLQKRQDCEDLRLPALKSTCRPSRRPPSTSPWSRSGHRVPMCAAHCRQIFSSQSSAYRLRKRSPPPNHDEWTANNPNHTAKPTTSVKRGARFANSRGTGVLKDFWVAGAGKTSVEQAGCGSMLAA